MLDQHEKGPSGGQERRQAPRADYLILVNFMVGGRVYSDYAQNVSMNGASIRCPETSSFHVRQPVSISFPMVKSQRQILGEIVWVGDNEFGVAFRGVGVKCKELSVYESENEERDSALAKEQSGLGRIRQKRVRWERSGSEDVTGYRLYWSRNTSVDYDSNHIDLGSVTEVILPHGVPSFPLFAGEIRLGITALNSVGNESAITEITGYFNFLIPEAPQAIAVEDLGEK
jgi:hypothetical protein